MEALESALNGWKHKRGEAIESLRVLNIGPLWFRAGENVTNVETARATQIVAEMDALIAAHEQASAQRRKKQEARVLAHPYPPKFLIFAR